MGMETEQNGKDDPTSSIHLLKKDKDFSGCVANKMLHFL